ncbi:hypothetical protein S83_055219, partial [Arachis hypogaea]
SDEEVDPLSPLFVSITAGLSALVTTAASHAFDTTRTRSQCTVLPKHVFVKGLELIPSKNFTSVSVMEAVGSIMTNKYSEGYPGAKYYSENEYIDMAETLRQKRALEAFRLDPVKWG